MNNAQIRLGVDIGGTFTDVVLEVDGRHWSVKVLTTYTAPEDGILQGLEEVCAQAGIVPAQIGQIIHGTTLATNALIERRGARTALITTEGFRDVIEMRTESRFEQYDLNLQLPEPLIPRQHRFTVPERIAANGDVLLELDQEPLDALIEELRAQDFQSVAIGLLHAYANPRHEQMVAAAIKQHLPAMMVSISSEVSPQMREYERFNTVVANAYIKPLMKSYLDRLEARLADVGVRCKVFLMHSGGGIISLASAADFPVRLVESGPAGGAVFAAHIARSFSLDKVLSFDMGGTTAKICLIEQQSPRTSRVFEVARSYRFKQGSGMPISIPVIDMVEIGAGGGSLASVDGLRQIRVGPQSAGSEPGPACYARGGDRPAVTDADLLLGKLDPENFAGGSIMLDRAASERALDSAIGSELKVDSLTAARGVAEVVDENMANAARVHAVENGEDLARYTMIAFGGAAPLHAARLAGKLRIDKVLVPPGAGVGSAIGFLRAPFSFEANRSVYMRLSDFDATQIADLLSELQREASGFVRNCDAESPINCEYKVYMRYVGQGWEIPVGISEAQANEPRKEEFLHLFEQAYRRLFARTVAGMDIEITVWAVHAATSVAEVEKLGLVTEGAQQTAGTTRELFDPQTSSLQAAGIVARSALTAGAQVDGPAVIVEDETSIVVPDGAHAVMQVDGCVLIHLPVQSVHDEESQRVSQVSV